MNKATCVILTADSDADWTGDEYQIFWVDLCDNDGEPVNDNPMKFTSYHRARRYGEGKADQLGIEFVEW